MNLASKKWPIVGARGPDRPGDCRFSFELAKRDQTTSSALAVLDLPDSECQPPWPRPRRSPTPRTGLQQDALPSRWAGLRGEVSTRKARQERPGLTGRSDYLRRSTRSSSGSWNRLAALQGDVTRDDSTPAASASGSRAGAPAATRRPARSLPHGCDGPPSPGWSGTSSASATIGSWPRPGSLGPRRPGVSP